MTKGAGCRCDSLSCDYSLWGKKIDSRKETRVWSGLQTNADDSLLLLVAGHQDIFRLTECRNSSLSFCALTLQPSACLLYALSGFIWFAVCHYYFCSPGSFATVLALFRFSPTCLVIPVQKLLVCFPVSLQINPKDALLSLKVDLLLPYFLIHVSFFFFKKKDASAVWLYKETALLWCPPTSSDLASLSFLCSAALPLWGACWKAQTSD